MKIAYQMHVAIRIVHAFGGTASIFTHNGARGRCLAPKLGLLRHPRRERSDRGTAGLAARTGGAV